MIYDNQLAKINFTKKKKNTKPHTLIVHSYQEYWFYIQNWDIAMNLQTQMGERLSEKNKIQPLYSDNTSIF